MQADPKLLNKDFQSPMVLHYFAHIATFLDDIDESRTLNCFLDRNLMVSCVKCVKCHSLTIMTIYMRQFDDRCHNSMYSYVNGVCQSVYIMTQMIFFLVFYQTLLSQVNVVLYVQMYHEVLDVSRSMKLHIRVSAS